MSTLLDTNVLSELLRAAPAPSVLAWFAEQPAETIFGSAVTQTEMLLGARLLPAGKRRSKLEAAVGAMFSEDFEGRFLPFDSAAVTAYVDIVSLRRAVGPNFPIRRSDRCHRKAKRSKAGNSEHRRLRELRRIRCQLRNNVNRLRPPATSPHTALPAW